MREIKAYKERWKRENPAYDREYRERNREYFRNYRKEYYANNRDKFLQYEAKRQHVRDGVDHDGTTRQEILAKTNGRCIYCKKVAEEIDHVWPRARGGPWTYDNLVATCWTCNRGTGGKFDRIVSDWWPQNSGIAWADLQPILMAAGISVAWMHDEIESQSDA
ncbi:HNH endonuclease [Streptomyces abyssalis]|uniref:HNH endonuclease n=1 Tax=Streptomyces abyssalis TaxID=933944 RepID=UPI001495A372|nr:HNH endonuclease [Streptomyces abyssalis]